MEVVRSNDAINGAPDRPWDMKLQEQKEVDSMLARGLAKMSVQERETIYEEIHGVEQMIEETPDFIRPRLDLMEKELCNIREKPAYKLAESISRDYVTDTKFRLMFLRAEAFDSKKAAIRMAKFFDGKYRLFGKDTLVRPLHITDLDEDSRVVLDSGCYQWLPSRDRSGRVVFMDMANMIQRTWKRGLSMAKASHYLIMSALEDEETQRRGVVGLMYHMGQTTEVDPEFIKEGAAAMNYLPYKFVCVHMCFGNPWVNAYARALLAVTGPEYRARVRLHNGSHTELQYSLMTFGLPMDLFPVTTDGDVKMMNAEKWIAKRQRKESLSNSATQGFGYRADFPGRYDVLVGKGKPFQRHVGNVRLRTMVEAHVEEYSEVRKGGKAELTRRVLNKVRKDGGRFVRKDTDEFWIEVPDSDALDKISKLFTSIKATSKAGRRRASKACNQTDCQKRARTGCFRCFGEKLVTDM